MLVVVASLGIFTKTIYAPADASEMLSGAVALLCVYAASLRPYVVSSNQRNVEVAAGFKLSPFCVVVARPK